MPLRQLKHKVGDQLFDTKQAAVEYAAANGGTPEKIIVETDQFIQADPEVVAKEEVAQSEDLTEAAQKKASTRSRKSDR